MSLATTKPELAKRLLEIKNKNIIKYIKAIFDSHEESWFENQSDDCNCQLKKH